MIAALKAVAADLLQRLSQRSYPNFRETAETAHLPGARQLAVGEAGA